jgi:8-oxo-dGTP diphosphatase
MEGEKKRTVHPSSPYAPLIGVAAAVVLRTDGRFLLAQRPQGKPYAGYWEFPGGKLLPGETPLAALKRELKEELDLIMEDAYPWLVRDYVYPHASVRLHFFRVVRWRGNASALEGQAVAWQRPGITSVTPMLPANAPILRALTLPSVYAISNAYDIGVESFVQHLENALERGIKMIQLREKQMPPGELHALARRIVKIAEPYGAKVLLNSAHMLNAEKIGVHGIHLTAERLMQCEQRPAFDLCGASCHNESELARAAELESDFVVLGPVRKTPKHGQQTPLGWRRLSRLISSYPLPVYAIGGMQSDDLEQAWRRGAHGVAMIRGAWRLEDGGQKTVD